MGVGYMGLYLNSTGPSSFCFAPFSSIAPHFPTTLIYPPWTSNVQLRQHVFLPTCNPSQLSWKQSHCSYLNWVEMDHFQLRDINTFFFFFPRSNCTKWEEVSTVPVRPLGQRPSSQAEICLCSKRGFPTSLPQISFLNIMKMRRGWVFFPIFF